MPTDPLDDFRRTTFTHGGRDHTVYRAGEGTAVIVLAELPGITPKVADFARKVIARGHTVFMPHLFGADGVEGTTAQIVKVAPKVCVSREFQAFALRTTPPAIDWLRALARHAHSECGGPGVGAVGMCFTGGFALAMSVEPALLAPVLSQPSLPIGFGARRRGDLAISDSDLLKVIERTQTEDLCVLGVRFTHDPLSPRDRFRSLRRMLGDAFIGVEIDSSKGNQWGHRNAAHSVLTEDLVDEPGQPTHDALVQVLDFFDERLSVSTPASE